MADEHSTHTETGHGGGGHGAFPPFQPDAFASQIVWLALTFGALYFLMSRVALPRVGAILAQRKDSIGSQLDAAAAMQAKAKEASEAHDKSIAEAKSKAQALAQAARDQLAAQSDASRKSLDRRAPDGQGDHAGCDRQRDRRRETGLTESADAYRIRR